MSEVIEFPGREPPPEGYSKEHIDELHAEAFRELEGRLSDCVSMAVIAMELAMNAIEGREPKAEKAQFSVCHVAEMLIKLQKDYQHAYHGENRGGLHTSSV
jgi:hypothetical protein